MINKYPYLSKYLCNCNLSFKRFNVSKIELPTSGEDSHRLLNAMAMSFRRKEHNFSFIRVERNNQNTIIYIFSFEHEHNILMKIAMGISSWKNAILLDKFSNDNDLEITLLLMDVIKISQNSAEISTSVTYLPTIYKGRKLHPNY